MWWMQMIYNQQMLYRFHWQWRNSYNFQKSMQWSLWEYQKAQQVLLSRPSRCISTNSSKSMTLPSTPNIIVTLNNAPLARKRKLCLLKAPRLRLGPVSPRSEKSKGLTGLTTLTHIIPTWNCHEHPCLLQQTLWKCIKRCACLMPWLE